jgi:hypothetical protein
MRSSLLLRALAPAALLGAAIYLGVGPAAAEQAGGGGVGVSLDGRVSPSVLPRQGAAPVSIFLSGSVRSTTGQPPPTLREMEVVFGAVGRLDTAGLPVCPRSRLRNATRRQALQRCPGALVGRGSALVEVPLSPAEPIRARARVLAFNGRAEGRPAVWVHGYSPAPAVSFVLPFYMRRPGGGPYGLSLRSPVRRALGAWPRLRSFEIVLGRRYRAAGEPHSYLSAHCPLPPRFTHFDAPLARATYRFSPAPAVDVAISRPCRVRR